MENSGFEFNTEIDIEAPPDLVFRFFTEADLVARWHGTYAECDARPEGVFFLNVTGADTKIGKFIEIDPPHRVVFTWGHEAGLDDFPPGSSTVEATFEAITAGTRVRIRQHSIPTQFHRDTHEVGWSHYLGRLMIVARGDDPGPDPWRKCDPPQKQSILGSA